MRALKLSLVSLAFVGVSIRAIGEEVPRPDDPKPSAQTSDGQPDPFADLTDTSKPEPAPEPGARSWRQTFFTENFGFRKEIMSQFDTSEHGQPASRQSVGFEVLKKFSTGTATVASFNFQGRLVRRDGFQPVLNDMEGESRPGWAFEYHNLYLDLYNVLNPVIER